MTVLDLDPPPPALRLVSTNGLQATRRDHRYRSNAQLHGQARELYGQVLQASLEWQQPICADSLRVVLAVKQATSAAPTRAFSATEIWQLMFVDIVAWCRNRQLDVPAGCTTALIRTIDYLDATDSFSPHSDTTAELLEAIDECTGGWVDEHPASPRKARRSLRSDRGPKRT